MSGREWPASDRTASHPAFAGIPAYCPLVSTPRLNPAHSGANCQASLSAVGRIGDRRRPHPPFMTSPKPGLDALRIDRSSARSGGGGTVWLVVLVLLVLGGGAVWWVWLRPKPVVVRTITARVVASGSGSARTLLNGSGYVTARREATVSSKVTGKVVEVMVEEGLKVEEGQILAKIDSSNAETSLRLAEAQVESARRILEETKPVMDYAESELKRLEGLVAANATSQSEYRKAESEARMLKARLIRQEADLAVAQRQVDQCKQQIDDTIIRAPFAGIVTTKNSQPGEMISPMSAGGGFTRTGICTMVDMASLEIEVDVSESYINRVQAGQPVEATLDAYPEWKIPAKVIAIVPTADRQKATVKVRVGFDKLDPRILPQMGVKVAFRSSGETEAAAPGKSSLVLPKAALRSADGRDIVWVVADGKLERRAVTTALDGDEATITAGLSANEAVVADPAADLTEGMNVIVEKNK